MAKKAELLEQAKKLKLEVTAQSTIAEIEAAIKAADLKPEVAKKIAKIIDEPIAGTEPEDSDDEKLAKAGKRSEKHIKEVEEKIAKEERKEKGDTTPVDGESVEKVKKGPAPIVRPLIERRSKAYRKAAELIDKSKTYNLDEALDLVVKTGATKFDSSVEIHVRLGVDPRQADQNIRATMSLPKGTGKVVRVAVFAPEIDHAAATKAGADIVGDDVFMKQLEKGEINFDVLISTPQYMPKLGKYARLLGPKGLMPNPKAGTVAVDVAKAVKEAKAGKVEYRVDKQAIVHLSIGKVSFGAADLKINAMTFFDSLNSHKPTSLKGVYIKSTSISTTMGPAIKVENIVN